MVFGIPQPPVLPISTGQDHPRCMPWITPSVGARDAGQKLPQSDVGGHTKTTCMLTKASQDQELGSAGLL